MNTRSSLILIGAGIAIFAAVFSVRVSSQAAPTPAAPQAAPSPATPEGRSYVGSETCRRCHAATYERWSKTRMANVVTDPKTRPEVVLPDLSKPDPLVTFKLDDIAFVYGSKWKQRYFTRIGDDL